MRFTSNAWVSMKRAGCVFRVKPPWPSATSKCPAALRLSPVEPPKNMARNKASVPIAQNIVPRVAPSAVNRAAIVAEITVATEAPVVVVTGALAPIEVRAPIEVALPTLLATANRQNGAII